MARDSKPGPSRRRRDSDRRLAVQYEVSRVLAASEALGDAAPELLRAVCEGLDWELGQLWVVDPAGERLCFLAAWHASTIDEDTAAALRHGGQFARGVGLPGRVWASCRPSWVTDLTRCAGLAH